MNPFARGSRNKRRRRFGILDILKKLIAAIIIIFAIAVIFYSIPDVAFVKKKFPSDFLAFFIKYFPINHSTQVLLIRKKNPQNFTIQT
jgi:hypothetical protein